MKIATGTLLLWLLVGGSICCDAFATPTTTTPPTTTQLRANSNNSKLTPPVSVQDISDAQSVYDENVQKTYGRFPLTIASGHGCYLTTTDGREYLDCVAGIATCALGHSNADLTTAVHAQMKQVHHVSNLYLIPAQAALAKWLVDNSVATKIFFCNSGAEANEAAIKCARKRASTKTTKPVILTAHQSFHGRTMASLSATAQPKYHQGFQYDGAMVPGFKYVTYNDVTSLKQAVADLKPDEALAGILMEALQGEGGIIPGEADFFTAARKLCDDHDALLICDEVQIGMGRSGKLWGYENLPGNVKPDIFTSAKALGGGVPIGAMCAGPRAADVFGPGDHASTYGGNPLACAAGLAVAQYMVNNNVLDNVQALGMQLTAGLESVRAEHPDVLGEIRGWGLLQGIEVKDESNILPAQIVQAAMDEGLLLVGAGANMVRFVPPLIITESEMEDAMRMFAAAVAAVTVPQVA